MAAVINTGTMSPAANDRLFPEQWARVRIDAMLEAAGWVVQDYRAVNLYAGTGVALRELVTTAGPADYVLFVNRQVVGVIEAKRGARRFRGSSGRLQVPEQRPRRAAGPPWVGHATADVYDA